MWSRAFLNVTNSNLLTAGSGQPPTARSPHQDVLRCLRGSDGGTARAAAAAAVGSAAHLNSLLAALDRMHWHMASPAAIEVHDIRALRSTGCTISPFDCQQLLIPM